MIKQYSIKLYSINGQKDDYGHYKYNPVFVRNIDCDMQPYSKELLLKSYGYNIDCNKRFFCDYDASIDLDSVLVYTDDASNRYCYQVTKIINWDNSNMEIAALEVNDIWNLSQI